MNISIIGTGYVGLVTGACFASIGHRVLCVDTDRRKLDLIRMGISPLYENGLEDLLKYYKNNLKATDDYSYAIKNSEITFICVGTPSMDSGEIDLTYVKESVKTIAKLIQDKKRWHTIVIKSTVIPGTSQNIVLPILEKYSGKKVGREIGFAVNPEFLREGVAVQDFLKPDRIVYGICDNKTAEIMKKIYHGFSCPIVETSLSSAEMIKYASNCFLATKISFINEIGNLCKHLGIDCYEVADGMGGDHRIGRAFLDAGIGWGGSCFPKDLKALITWAHQEKCSTLLLENVVQVNDNQPSKLINLLKHHLPIIEKKTIGILGLAFKPDTDDVRESRAIPIVKRLLDEGAKIKAYDPKAMKNFKNLFPSIEYCCSAQEVLNADAILITTKWSEFSQLDYNGKIVIDGRRISNAKNARIYEGVCW